MKKEIELPGASVPGAESAPIEQSPALFYLEANKYYILKEERAFKPDGSMGVRVLTFINDGVGLEVVLSWPARTGQVLLSGVNGGQIVAPMRCLYDNVDVLQAFLIDASALRAGRFNANNSNNR